MNFKLPTIETLNDMNKEEFFNIIKNIYEEVDILLNKVD